MQSPQSRDWNSKEDIHLELFPKRTWLGCFAGQYRHHTVPKLNAQAEFHIYVRVDCLLLLFIVFAI